jgi:hypothetical protein
MNQGKTKVRWLFIYQKNFNYLHMGKSEFENDCMSPLDAIIIMWVLLSVNKALP